VDERRGASGIPKQFSRFTYTVVMVSGVPMIGSKLREARIQPAMNLLKILAKKLKAVFLVLIQGCHIPSSKNSTESNRSDI